MTTVTMKVYLHLRDADHEKEDGAHGCGRYEVACDQCDELCSIEAHIHMRFAIGGADRIAGFCSEECAIQYCNEQLGMIEHPPLAEMEAAR